VTVDFWHSINLLYVCMYVLQDLLAELSVSMCMCA